jgi:hypothetical protein
MEFGLVFGHLPMEHALYRIWASVWPPSDGTYKGIVHWLFRSNLVMDMEFSVVEPCDGYGGIFVNILHIDI